MDRNRIKALPSRASVHDSAKRKTLVIKTGWRKCGGCAVKVLCSPLFSCSRELFVACPFLTQASMIRPWKGIFWCCSGETAERATIGQDFLANSVMLKVMPNDVMGEQLLWTSESNRNDQAWNLPDAELHAET